MSAENERLLGKVKTLNDTIWEQQAKGPVVEAWLGNFADPAVGTVEQQQLHALHLLSKFMYFGRREMRELLKALFRDLYRYPVIAGLRRQRSDTTDADVLGDAFAEELARTRFLGVGNPAESGTHLLYYFRQENGLPSELFLNAYRILGRDASGRQNLRSPNIKRYVFIDDFCGSGTQAVDYSRDIVDEIKAVDGAVEVCYYVLFATDHGLRHIRSNASFDRVESVFELDESYRCFGDASRYFPSANAYVTREFGRAMCHHYGQSLCPGAPLGYKDGQLLIGFSHNTPDNTLPVVWSLGNDRAWRPVFRRYPKLYDAGGI